MSPLKPCGLTGSSQWQSGRVLTTPRISVQTSRTLLVPVLTCAEDGYEASSDREGRAVPTLVPARQTVFSGALGSRDPALPLRRRGFRLADRDVKATRRRGTDGVAVCHLIARTSQQRGEC